MAGLNRRAFLARAALLAFAGRYRAIGQGPRTISIDEFLRLSQRLTGRTTLDARVAATYLGALLAVPANGPLLAQLTRNGASGSDLSPAHVALERTIIEWWYTGIYTVDGESRVATHADALMWAALGMPAPGTCAGVFGAWSRAPRME